MNIDIPADAATPCRANPEDWFAEGNERVTSVRRAQVAELTAAGLHAADIADRLGITPRAVVRHRAAIREAAEVGA